MSVRKTGLPMLIEVEQEVLRSIEDGKAEGAALLDAVRDELRAVDEAAAAERRGIIEAARDEAGRAEAAASEEGTRRATELSVSLDALPRERLCSIADRHLEGLLW